MVETRLPCHTTGHGHSNHNPEKLQSATSIAEPACDNFTNCIERDHRCIKQRVRAMQTFHGFLKAQITIAGIEMAH